MSAAVLCLALVLLTLPAPVARRRRSAVFGSANVTRKTQRHRWFWWGAGVAVCATVILGVGPLIAAVEGAALAGGTEIVLACDLVVAAEDARFGVPEVKRGLIAAAGGLFRLGRKIPLNLAMECVLTGDPIDAPFAHRHGLVNSLCAPGEALQTAVGLAHRITANAPLAVRESRSIVLDCTGVDDAEAWRRSEESADRVFASEDVREGVAAFLEKRAPAWTGR